jgi:hypothetical protein
MVASMVLAIASTFVHVLLFVASLVIRIFTHPILFIAGMVLV